MHAWYLHYLRSKLLGGWSQVTKEDTPMNDRTSAYRRQKMKHNLKISGHARETLCVVLKTVART